MTALLALLICAPTGAVAGKVTAEPDKYLKDTVVYIRQAPAAPAPAPKTLTLDQKGMSFAPRILIITAGDSVKFLNSDGVDHNVYTPDGDAYNLGVFPKGQAREHKFDAPGVYTQLCSIHPEMLAYIFVGQNPHAAVVKKDGSFQIDGVPAGTYTLSIWNAKLKADDSSVTIEAGKTAKADFALAR